MNPESRLTTGFAALFLSPMIVGVSRQICLKCSLRRHPYRGRRRAVWSIPSRAEPNGEVVEATARQFEASMGSGGTTRGATTAAVGADEGGLRGRE